MHTLPACARPNTALAGLPLHEIEQLLPHLHSVTLTQSQILYDAGDTIDQVYFPTGAVISCVVTLAGGGMIESLIIAEHGAAGSHAVYGIRQASWRHIVQLAGDALAITPQALADALPETPELRRRLARHAYLMQQEAAQTVACNRFHPVVERLARWLLTMLDRTDSVRLPMTHEFLGLMLGAHRPTVTLALRQLSRAGLIEPAHRAQVILLDRAGLEDAACECYATIARAAQLATEPAVMAGK